jgi:hypothetical protein
VNPWVSLTLSLIIGVLASWVANHIPLSKTLKENPIDLGAFAAITLLTAINARRLQAYIRLHTVANIRGLWGGDLLHKSIAVDYKNSTCVDIKITRGFGLFLKEDGIFKKLIFEQKNPKIRKVRILLHYPCLESDHIRRRATANHKSLDEYVDDLFKVLRKLFTHSEDPDTGELISVRFYVSDKDSEWRFYVLEDDHGKKTLYFNHYDDSRSGAKSRMLKVVEGQHSLCDELKKTFDEIFENASFEVVENHVSPRLLNSDRCGHPGCEQKIRNSFERHFRHG